MSFTYRQTISDELAARVEQRRGPLSLQDFTTFALAAACGESPVVVELRAEIDRLHETLRCVSAVSPPNDSVLSW